jgi:hypothetical protein
MEVHLGRGYTHTYAGAHWDINVIWYPISTHMVMTCLIHSYLHVIFNLTYDNWILILNLNNFN